MWRIALLFTAFWVVASLAINIVNPPVFYAQAAFTPTPTTATLPPPLPPPDEGGPISSGQTVSGNVWPWGDSDNWTFNANRGDMVAIRLHKASGSPLNTYLELIAPGGGLETYDDDGGGNLNSLIINWELRESGTYTIVARGYGPSIGPYTLSLLWSAATVAPTPMPPITPTRTSSATPTSTRPIPTPSPILSPGLVTNEFGTYIPYINEAGETYALSKGSDVPGVGFVWIPIGQLTVEYIPIPASAWDGGIYAYQYAMMLRFNPAWITGPGSEYYSRFPSLSEISTLPQAMQDIFLAEMTFQPPGGLNDGTDDGSASKGKDTYVANTRYGDSGTNFGNSTELFFDYYVYYDGYPLLQFDVSTLPSNIASAKLYLYVTASCGSGSCPAMSWTVKSIASPWNEMTATWDAKPALSGSYGTLNIPASPTGIINARWVSVDITTLYNGWKNGTIPNYGVGFSRLGASWDGGVWFNTIASSDYETASLRPKLVIQITPIPPTPIPPTPTFITPTPVQGGLALPSSFYGTAKVDGANAPEGATVTAWIAGMQVASTNTSLFEGDSVYRLVILSDEPITPTREGGVEGDTITFKIGDYVAEPGTWRSGTNVELNLTFRLLVSPAVALASIASQLVLVYAADSPGQWKLYDPRAPAYVNTLERMERGKGYWIKVNSATTLTYGGRSYPLGPGWNLVGWMG